jgi:hypothetical protein
VAEWGIDEARRPDERANIHKVLVIARSKATKQSIVRWIASLRSQ